MSVTFLYENCTKCKACYNHCPNDVIAWSAAEDAPFMAYPDECSHCGVCALECRFAAIRHTIPLACYDDSNTFTPAVNQPREFDWQKWL